MPAALLLLAFLFGADPNLNLKRAELLYADLDYEGAAAALQTAQDAQNTQLPDLIRILELQGLIAVALDMESAGINYFRQLLAIAPKHVADARSYSATQREAFAKARALLHESGSLTFIAAPSPPDRVAVRVPNDPLNVGLNVRFRFRVGPGVGSEYQHVEPLTDRAASAPIPAGATAWWAELLGSNDAQLALIGAPGHLIALGSGSNGGSELGGRRTLALVAGGASVIAAAGGVVFGVQNRMTNNQLDTVRSEIASYGRVFSRTQAEVLALVEDANRTAIIADILFGAAVVLGAGGAYLWFVEPATGPSSGGLTLNVAGRW